MDGEHAFAASLTLTMVNAAFPYNERDARAMETALSVLQGMAGKGNEYIQARLSLLTNLRSTIGRRSPNSGHPSQSAAEAVPEFPATGSADIMESANLLPATASLLLDTSLQSQPIFHPFQDISLDFELEDDPKFWEEIYGNIDIDMETGWIEDALRNDVQQGQWNG